MVRELITLPARLTFRVLGGVAGAVGSRIGGSEADFETTVPVAEPASPRRRPEPPPAPVSEQEREAIRGRDPDAGDWDEDAPVPPGGSDPDDLLLTDRVKTELFGAVDVPTGQVNLNVENGVVFLRGNLDDPEQIEELVVLASAVEGVVRVENLIAG